MRGITMAFTLTIVGVAGAFLAFTSDLVPYSGSDAYFRQPKFFPIVTLVGLILVGVTLSIRYASAKALPVDEELAGTRPHFVVLVPLAVCFVLYIFAVPHLGFLIATLLFGCGALIIGRHFTFGSAASVLALGVLLYLVFVTYLEVWFPAGNFPFLDWVS